MKQSDERISFGIGAPDPVVAAMAALAPSAGWVVLHPAINEEDAPPPSGMFRVFSGRGSLVPVVSWVPGERTRGGIEHVAVGIEHGAGPKAARRLEIDARWVVMQDHPRRGLIVAIPPADPHDVVLAWMLRAAATLAPMPLTGEWLALVYRR